MMLCLKEDDVSMQFLFVSSLAKIKENVGKAGIQCVCAVLIF